jgi:hypothetical protein
MVRILLVDELKVIAQGLPADGTFANFQIDAREIMDVIDAHFVRNGETAESGIFLFRRVEPTRRQQGVTLANKIDFSVN